MSKIYSDGQGCFLYVDKDEDDDFISFRIEEEQADDSYVKAELSLHKSDIENLIIEIRKLTFGGLTSKRKKLLKESMGSANIEDVSLNDIRDIYKYENKFSVSDELL